MARKNNSYVEKFFEAYHNGKMEEFKFNADSMRKIYEEKHKPIDEQHELKIEQDKKEVMHLIKQEAESGECEVILYNLENEVVKFLKRKQFKVDELIRNDYLVCWGKKDNLDRVNSVIIFSLAMVAIFILVIIYDLLTK